MDICKIKSTHRGIRETTCSGDISRTLLEERKNLPRDLRDRRSNQHKQQTHSHRHHSHNWQDKNIMSNCTFVYKLYHNILIINFMYEFRKIVVTNFEVNNLIYSLCLSCDFSISITCIKKRTNISSDDLSMLNHIDAL